MTHGRDEEAVKAGWARHILGGYGDSGGSNPQVKSIGVVQASSQTSDQLWVTAKRFINGTSVMTVEIMTTPYEDTRPQSDAFYFDCGFTYESPVAITGINVAGSAVITATSHGINNGSSVTIAEVMGLNLTVTDINGVVTSSSFVNEKTFIVASTTANTFYLQDFSGNFLTASSYSTYVSGGVARRLVSRVSGLTWLKNETVGVLTDGGIHPDVLVNSAGVAVLNYEAGKVQIGYRYNSDGKILRVDAGSADGSAIGKTRRIARAAFLLHACGDFSFGPNFARLLPCEFTDGYQVAGQATPLFSGIMRDGVESEYDFDNSLCFRQNTGLPGVVQSLTLVLDEFDV